MIEVYHGELDKLRLRPGDLLVVEGNGSPDQIGRSALWDGSIDPCVHQNHLIRVRPGTRVLPEYLNLCWNAPSTSAAIRGVASSTSGLYTLSTGKVRAIPMTLPPLELQHEIIGEVERALSSAGVLEAELATLRAKTRALRRAVLSAAFAGKLSEQDPADEDAAAQLTCIAAERGSITKQRRPQPARAPTEVLI
jgi:type I restriction enzyme S subunit